MSALGRRRFLAGLGGGLALAPFIPLLDSQAGPGAPLPKRLVFFFSSNGTIYESWLPTMERGELTLSPILAPLEKFKSKLLVVDGLCHKVVLDKGQNTGHAAGMNTALTGRYIKVGDFSHPLLSFATGISLDQYLAPKISGDTKLKSLECGVSVELFSLEFASLSYGGPHAPRPPESSPYVVFDRLFRNFSGPKSSGPTPEELARLSDRQSVLDSVSKNLSLVQANLPGEDRVKLEAHLDAVRGIEQSLTTGRGEAAADVCGKPSLTPKVDVWVNDHIPEVAKMQMDLLVMALACDLTRVGTVQFGHAGAQHRFNWLGAEFKKDPELSAADQAKGFHALAHREAEATSRAKLVRINAWYAQQLAYLLGKLDAIPERGGTMLDHTVVVWVNELGTGSHSHERLPWVIAGNSDKYFKTGQLVSFPGEPHNRLLLSLSHAMGVEDEVFGDPDYCGAGPLTGLTG
ncbi:MAG: DUF1552 domain-containing protein [Polyangiaceae bacterium]